MNKQERSQRLFWFSVLGMRNDLAVKVRYMLGSRNG